LGIVARFQGNFDQAQELNEESLAIRREVGDRWAIANSLNNQGTVFLDQEEYDNAQQKLEEAVSLLREIGDRWHYVNAVNNLANVARAQNRYGVARDLYYESLEINRELGDDWALAYLLEDVGYWNAAEGFPKIALELIGAADTLRESIGAPLPPAERENSEKLLKPARDGLSSEAQEAALEAGRLMSLEQAIEFTETTPRSN
jgi:tetratricopeptide (TPR) repeat protein